MKNTCILLLLILGLCGTIFSQNSGKSPINLRKLNDKERVEFARDGIFPTSKTVYKNLLGENILNVDSLDATEIFYDCYVNPENQIMECLVRPITPDDKILWKQIVDAMQEKMWGNIQLVKPDCNANKDTLAKVLIRDQKDRAVGKINLKTDKENLEIVLGIIEYCGFPTLDKVGKDGMRATFLTLQHSTRKIREKYLPLLIESAKKGDLSSRAVAMMEDRLLMESGEKQKYGTQFNTDKNTGKTKLYPLENPDKVNERRLSMGLDSIEVQLKQFGVNYKLSTKP